MRHTLCHRPNHLPQLPQNLGLFLVSVTLNSLVPYTPRQRVAPTSATTATAHPPSPQQQGDATSKLQLMHLKAAAQNIGLDSGTLGWSILEKSVLDCDYSEEWMEIYNAYIYIYSLYCSSLT
jgi:hypothetical protein